MDAVASDPDDRLDIGLEGVADNRYLRRWDKFHMADVKIFLDAFFCDHNDPVELLVKPGAPDFVLLVKHVALRHENQAVTSCLVKCVQCLHDTRKRCRRKAEQ